MIVIYNKLIPFKGFMAINLFGIVFVRSEFKDLQDDDFQRMLRHEAIHSAQMREMLYIGFYIWYLIEWIIKLFKYGKNAYSQLLHEKEAYNNMDNLAYLKTRKHYAWLRKNN